MSAEVERPARMEDRRVRRTRAQLRTAFTSLMAENRSIRLPCGSWPTGPT